MLRDELSAYLDGLLEPGRYRDYCPNGLQVEGRAEVRRIVCGVTASQALIDAAIKRGADALLVHHGWFWKGEDGRITGFRKRRLQTLLAHDINLFAYHLPLDAHAELGNNAQLAKRLGWAVTGRFAEQDIGFLGTPRSAGVDAGAVSPAPTFAAQIAAQIGAALGREAMLVGNGERIVRKLAWCSGGAQGYFEQAILAGADLFVSGEISEQTVHLARESGVPYLAAGHHATERYGAMALGEHLAGRCGLECEFVDIDNPV
jgi:dinuclear metal center YbgI/SA1388 family protein